MPARHPISIPKVNPQNVQGLWTFLFFVLLLVIFFSYDEVMSLIPASQARTLGLYPGDLYPGDMYPGDANWDSSFYTSGPDNTTSALAVDGSNVFVGGDFYYAGNTRLNDIGYWDGTVWHDMDGGTPTAFDSVSAIAVSSDNVFVGGSFSYIGTSPGAPGRNIAVWSKTTKKWSALQGGVNGPVTALAASSTDVIVVGRFTTAGEVQTNNLARWNIATQTWHAFGSLSNWDTIDDIAVDGQNVYIVGNFSQIEGQPARNVAYWDGTTWHAMETIGSDDNYIHNQIVAKNGQVVVVTGELIEAFYEIKVKRWNGTEWTELSSTLPGYPIDMIVSPDGALIFALHNHNETGCGIYRWDEASSTYDRVVTIPGHVSKMVFQGADLILMGSFQNAGDFCSSNLLRWNGSQWSTFGTSTSVNNTVLSVTGPSADNLYIGGTFTCAGTEPAKLVAHWDGKTLRPIGDGLSGGYARLAWDNTRKRLYAVGSFTADNNPAIKNIAYLENGVWMPLGSAVDQMWDTVSAISVSGDTIVIAFPSSAAISQIYSLQNDTWQPLGGSMIGEVKALAIMGNDIFAGGSFSFIDDTNLNFVARWDGSTWNSLGAGIGGPVSTLVVNEKDLLVGGDFSKVNGDPKVAYIARWDGSSWHSVGTWDATQVNKIVVYGGSVYAAHQCWQSDGIISRWDGTSWTRVGHVGHNSPYSRGQVIYDLAVFDEDIFVGGSFTSAGSNPSSYIGRWRFPVISGQVTGSTGPLSGVTILTDDGHSTTTDQNGMYTLNGANLGSTFSAAKSGYTFQPLFRIINEENIGPNLNGQNFTGISSTKFFFLPFIAR